MAIESPPHRHFAQTPDRERWRAAEARQVPGASHEVRLPRPAVQIRADVRERAENRPGVYRMIGPGGDVLYVGKSIRVRTRVLSYFRARPDEKAAEIISHTHHVEWEYVPSEFAAVLREMRLIQHHRPPFNVQHKRDRAFCFIKLTREAAPRLMTVFQVDADGACHFGPFHGPLRVREVVREVADVLELRDCAASTPMRYADQLDLFGWERSPLCLRADLGRCLAPCAGRCTRAQYDARAGAARQFLDGDADSPLAILRARMELASRRMNFEYAAVLRDRMHRLEAAREELLALRGLIESLSFVYQPSVWEGAPRVYLIHRGLVNDELPAPCSDAERDHILERARSLFRPRRSHGGVRATQAAEILLLARWFRRRPAELDNVWDAPRSAARDQLVTLRALA